MIPYRTVRELSKDELAELKEKHFWSEETDMDEYDYADEIPNSIIFEHYAHISFVKEDFFCNL